MGVPEPQHDRSTSCVVVGVRAVSRARSESTDGWRRTCPTCFAARDCLETYHPILGSTYLPLGRPRTSRAGWRPPWALGGGPLVRGIARHAGRQGLRGGRGSDRSARRGRTCGWPRSTDRRVGRFRSLSIPRPTTPGSRALNEHHRGTDQPAICGSQVVGHWEAQVAKRDRHSGPRPVRRDVGEDLSELDLSYALRSKARGTPFRSRPRRLPSGVRKAPAPSPAGRARPPPAGAAQGGAGNTPNVPAVRAGAVPPPRAREGGGSPSAATRRAPG
jgi:hypothetical protein